MCCVEPKQARVRACLMRCCDARRLFRRRRMFLCFQGAACGVKYSVGGDGGSIEGVWKASAWAGWHPPLESKRGYFSSTFDRTPDPHTMHCIHTHQNRQRRGAICV